MTRRWFGTDGIRARAGEEPLTDGFLIRLGRALAEEAEAGGLVLLARDTRESGPDIARALAAGLREAGVSVTDLGVLPTAGLPMAMRTRGADLGVVVSASHNPWQDNGLKVFGRDGLKLADEREEAVELRVMALAVDAAVAGDEENGLGHLVGLDGSPPAERENGTGAYLDVLERRFGGLDLSGFRLAVDCAHGAATVTAPAFLAQRGAAVTALCDAPDGRNINEGCGSTHLGNVADVVRAGDFDLGLAFDGDADRVLMVDATGRICHGDHMLGFLGLALARRDALPQRTVVATVMSNLGLERLLTEHDVHLQRTSVGDRHVLAAMRTNGHTLGGEASGHLLFAADDSWIGDGLYTALSMLESLRSEGRDLASVIDAVPAVPQVLLNIPVAARPPVESLSTLQRRVHAAEQEHGSDVRIVLRYSGTENLARVMVEGLDAEVVDSLSAELARLWEQEIAAQAS